MKAKLYKKFRNIQAVAVQCWWFEEEKVEIEKRNLKDIY
jgi:hypothetical protein